MVTTTSATQQILEPVIVAPPGRAWTIDDLYALNDYLAVNDPDPPPAY